MSVKVSSWVWEHSKAKGNDRLVLLCIADIANDQGEALSHARSQSFIQRKTKLSRTAVRDRIKSLVALGELEVVGQGSGRSQTGYRVLMRGSESGPLDAPTTAPESDPQRDGQTTLRGSVSDPQGDSEPTPHHPVLIPSSPVLTSSAPLALVPDPEHSPDDLFEMFWKSYPRKIDKKKAKRAFLKALKSATVAEIGGGLKRWKPYWAVRDPEFVPHPTTWLNGERWNDPVPESKPSMPKGADTIREWLAQ